MKLFIAKSKVFPPLICEYLIKFISLWRPKYYPVLVKNAFNLKDGQITSEIETNEGYNFLYLVDSKKGEALPFSEMNEKVKAEYIRRSDETALINYLEWLRQRYNIIYDEKFNE